MKVAAATLLHHRVLRWNELELPKAQTLWHVAHLKGCLSRNRFFDVFVSCFFFKHPFAGLVGVFCVVFFFVVGCWYGGEACGYGGWFSCCSASSWKRLRTRQLQAWSLEGKSHKYVPRTQMTLVLDDWTRKIEGQTLKIEVSWVLGIYNIYIYTYTYSRFHNLPPSFSIIMEVENGSLHYKFS